MDADELPASRSIGASASLAKLERLFEGLIESGPDHGFTGYELIEGDVRGGLVLYLGVIPPAHSIKFPSPMNPAAMAGELVNHWAGSMRYPTPAPKGKDRGWEIRVSVIGRRTILICWATYCTKIGYRPKQDVSAHS